jgi:hypothetical protein
MQTRDQIAKSSQRFNRDQRRSKREAGALRTEHPSRQRADRSVGQFDEQMLSVTVFHALMNTQLLAGEWMPMIVDGCRLENMCIM